jgi:hypothetical protein
MRDALRALAQANFRSLTGEARAAIEAHLQREGVSVETRRPVRT